MMNAPLNSQAVQAATFVFENADFVSRVHELLQLASEALVWQQTASSVVLMALSSANRASKIRTTEENWLKAMP
jgi:hypothetical protein